MTLQVRGLAVGWPGGPMVVHDLDLDVAPGELLAVTGASGAGKTTLLTALAGLLRPESGTVGLSGVPVVPGSAAVTLQGLSLVSTLTASENVEVLLHGRGARGRDLAAAARAALERVGLVDLGGRPVDELSGGQQQRVAVARAIALAAPLVLADEPTSELDPTTRDVVVRALREEADRGACVVLATHDPDITERCDRRLHLVDGRVAVPPAYG